MSTLPSDSIRDNSVSMVRKNVGGLAFSLCWTMNSGGTFGHGEREERERGNNEGHSIQCTPLYKGY